MDEQARIAAAAAAEQAERERVAALAAQDRRRDGSRGLARQREIGRAAFEHMRQHSPQCEAISVTTGQRCKKRVRPDRRRCRHHERDPQLRQASAKLRQRAAMWRERWCLIKAAPAALTDRPEWRAAATAGLATARWRMLLGWQTWQDSGDRAPWDAAVAGLVRVLTGERPGRNFLKAKAILGL